MLDKSIEFSNLDQRTFVPPENFVKQAKISSKKEYQELYTQSVTHPEDFWSKIANELLWNKKWDKILSSDNHPFVKWFDGARLNITQNMLDRHLKTIGSKTALIWEGENEEKIKLSYQELYDKVNHTANVLKAMGIQKRDRIVFYMPMTPEFLFSILACARIGAIHSVVFAGFSSNALRERILDCSAKLVITSDGAYRRGKILPLKKIVDEAIEKTDCIKNILVFQRTHSDHQMKEKRDIYWKNISPGKEGFCVPEIMNADDILFILYTSGSTGKPKGIQHSIAGYMVGAYTSFKYIFDIQQQDIFWCTADIGWITGHSYFVYGPLLNGTTIFMYEGAPDFPDCGRFWKLIERYKINIMYTAPTAIRAFMKWGDQWVDKYDLSSLRLLGTVGEPINPEAWMWFYQKIGNSKCPIVDTWWQTETGSIMITALPGAIDTKPGCATLPFFGVSPAIVDEKGNELPANEGGLLVIKKPWPSMASEFMEIEIDLLMFIGKNSLIKGTI